MRSRNIDIPTRTIYAANDISTSPFSFPRSSKRKKKDIWIQNYVGVSRMAAKSMRMEYIISFRSSSSTAYPSKHCMTYVKRYYRTIHLFLRTWLYPTSSLCKPVRFNPTIRSESNSLFSEPNKTATSTPTAPHLTSPPPPSFSSQFPNPLPPHPPSHRLSSQASSPYS